MKFMGGIEDDKKDKVVRGRIPWSSGMSPEEIAHKNGGLGSDATDFSEWNKYFEAATARARTILTATFNSDLREADRLRDYFVSEIQLVDVAQLILGASDKDIEDDPPRYRGAALALIKGREVENFPGPFDQLDP